jgi:hypothetical protein
MERIMSNFDRCFEQVLIGNKHVDLLHKFQVCPDRDIWHVCTVAGDGFYSHYYVRLDREKWTFTHLGNSIPPK